MKNQDHPDMCSAEEAALKSFFLGPQSENSDWLRQEILGTLDHWFQWRKDFYPEDGKVISRKNQKSEEFKLKRQLVHERLTELAQRFEHEVPQFSPRYVGHMYSEISLPALLGHFLALLHNPNNISTEAARVGAVIEDEAIRDLGKMIGFSSETVTGHFTSGGTVANIEALWRARYRLDHFLALGAYLNLNCGKKLDYFSSAHMGWTSYGKYLTEFSISEMELRNYSAVAMGPWHVAPIYERAFGRPYQGPVVLVPNSKHYSWLKAVSLLGIGDASFCGLELDQFGVLNIDDLKKKIEFYADSDRPILMVVSVAGTTELGECDPIDKVQAHLDQIKENSGQHLWHHVDAAYGGYFCSMNGFQQNDLPQLPREIQGAFLAIKDVDSVTLDPHKLGYVPYACGAIVVPDQVRYRVSAFDAKYIQSPTASIDRWMKTLEGSRSAAGATATWMTSKTIGFHQEGYGRILSRTILAKQQLGKLLKEQCPEFLILDKMPLNLLCGVARGGAEKLSDVNQQTLSLIHKIEMTKEFVISKTVLKCPEYEKLVSHHCQQWGLDQDVKELVLLRLTLMNPFFTTKEASVSFPQLFVECMKTQLANK